MNNSGRILVALLASTALAGCGTLDGAYDALNKRPRQAYATPALETALLVEPAVRNLGNALALDGLPVCTVPSDAAGADRPRDASGVSCTPRTALGVTPADVDAYLDRSIFVIDANCSAYLDSLSNLGDTSRWTRSQFNTVSNYIGVLMALAGQPAADLGYLNAGAGFFNASADNLESFILISPTPGKLTPLVRAAQTEMLTRVASVRQGDIRLRWSTTSRWIEDYAALCTPRGIRSQLDAAIENNTPGGSPAELANAASTLTPIVVATLSGLDSFDGIDSSEIARLGSSASLGAFAWRVQADGSLTDPQKEYITSVLGPKLSTAINVALASPDQAPYLKQILSGANAGFFTELRRSQEAVWAANSAADREARAIETTETAQEEARAATARMRDAEARAATAERELLELRDEVEELRRPGG